MEKQIDYYWYETCDFKYVIGIRGENTQITVSRWDIIRAEDYFRLRTGRSWTDREAIEWALKWARKESEYIDFEEVPKEILLLSWKTETKPNK
jgi:hypothetical protein